MVFKPDQLIAYLTILLKLLNGDGMQAKFQALFTPTPPLST